MRVFFVFLLLIFLAFSVWALDDPFDPEKDFEYGDPKKAKKDDLPKTRDFKRCKETDQNCIEYEFFSYKNLMFEELSVAQKLKRTNKFLKNKYSGWISSNKEYSIKIDSEGVP
jgi:hypothetical protein